MKSILGKKLGMTQLFAENGDCIPVTVIQVEKCVPVLKRTKEINGYEAVLVAYGERKAVRTNKPLQGFYDKVKASPARMMAEFRDEDLNDDELGKPMAVDIFSEGDIVNVKGVSKGKGFAGVMKRFGFAGAPASRGSHESFRGGGSIGMHTYPGRVFKNKEMPGHMGSETVHVKNLRVVRVDKEQNLLLIRGAIPGAKGNIIKIIKSRSAKA